MLTNMGSEDCTITLRFDVKDPVYKMLKSFVTRKDSNFKSVGDVTLVLLRRFAEDFAKEIDERLNYEKKHGQSERDLSERGIYF